MTLFLEQIGRGVCNECQRTHPKEAINDKGVCLSCERRELKARAREEKYLKSPQYKIDQVKAKKREKEKKGREELKRKDLEENYNLYEWTCPCCGDRKVRWIKKTNKNQCPDLYCSCPMSYRHYGFL